MKSRLFIKLNLFAVVLALVVIVLGAYTRLSDAGLGCPDWPVCYGHIGVPEHATDVAKANQAYPDRPVEAAKAWKEMIHRYFASTLGLVIVIMALIAIFRRKRNLDATQPIITPVFLVALVIFQGLLGMWTVTLLLKPIIVMGHLLGGMTIISLLVWQLLRYSGVFSNTNIAAKSLLPLKRLALVALVVVVVQISLGGWTSANYAALSCPDFPTCQDQWLPDLDFSEAFVPWQALSENKKDYEGGVLNNDANVTIHIMHRLGAIITLLLVGFLIIKLLLHEANAAVKRIAILLVVVLALQITLGISNVMLSLPLFIAVAHNAVGALLLLSMVLTNHALRPPKNMKLEINK
ncbi:Heme A synthase, cytochrome oxidase biogenesis protein Cox15-CtaA [hydrothermal vent metagenome]|uniref:Heme A synthase, cytochrome oxidase biogenesis protein Cox15-CtaA n=1 Tax=hydrothermal vent metagenome TaxID=652676 RepID=A0A3B1ANR5_9ZZZZ